MSAINLNRVMLTGNLTQDPELRSLNSGTSVCKLRVACNTRRKNGSTGDWHDKPNYFDVTVWGAHGENCARYLTKGRAIGIDGRLEWREWETDDGRKRQAVEIIADAIQFLAGPAGERADTPTADDEPADVTPRTEAATDPDSHSQPSTDDADQDIPF